VAVETGRRNRKLERPKERVLEETWTLLIEKGMADLTLAELGRRVGTSAGHLLYYFGSKDELLLEVLRWSEAQLAVKRAAVLASEEPIEVRLRRYVEAFLPVGAGDPRWLLWLEVWPRMLRDTGLLEPAGELDEAWTRDLAVLLEQASCPDPSAVARRACALMDGLSIAIVHGERGMTAEAAWEHVRAMLPVG
jgi:AcrR family transcriptional regulator